MANNYDGITKAILIIEIFNLNTHTFNWKFRRDLPIGMLYQLIEREKLTADNYPANILFIHQLSPSQMPPSTQMVVTAIKIPEFIFF